MSHSKQPYEDLCERFSEVGLLKSTSSLLNWDQETYMPDKAVTYRAKQGAYFSRKIHELGTAAEVGDWISACEDAGYPDESDEAANVREWRYDYDRATKLPGDLVSEAKERSSLALNAWAAARKDSNFTTFQPHLEKLVELSRRKADYWGYEDCRYDALLSEFERGAKTAELEQTLTEFKDAATPLVEKALDRSSAIPADVLAGDYPEAQQVAFNREVAEAIGFDFEGGRIDTTTHPFCSGMAPGDTRLTTRYDEQDFTSSLLGVLHEAGHGLYEQGLPHEKDGQPLCDSVSLGIHESQSRLWENHIGRSSEFWEHWFPRAVHFFPHLKSVGVEKVHAAVNRSTISFIRVESDEMTYDLHVYLRFILEKQLMDGSLAVADLPGAWSETYEKLFGRKLDTHSNGCLQDIHWSMGAFGYFPTYTLGNLNASQLYAKCLEQDSQIGCDLEGGDYSSLLNWMRKNVHQHGRKYLPSDLMERATGEKPQAIYHLNHLRQRYVG